MSEQMQAHHETELPSSSDVEGFGSLADLALNTRSS